MFALNWPWSDSVGLPATGLGQRLANSLGSGIGGGASGVDTLGLGCAYRPIGTPPRRPRAWRPAVLPGDRVVVFHGYLDNADWVRQTLAIEESDPARLYGAAVDRWGDEADNHLIGDYCAAVADVPRRRLRLSRSPLRAPPLFHAEHDGNVIAGSVPRIFFAAGLPQRLNEDRVVDSALMNFSNQEASWFQDIHRVPLGSLVELVPGSPRRLHRYYDPLAIETREIGDQEALDRTRELLAEGVRACLKGFSRPGLTLSGGLDSPQVAVQCLAALPPDREVPTFTFTPEPGWDGIVEPGFLGCESELVEAFAAMHPRLRTHWTTNEGYSHDYRSADFFHLMGGAPSGLTNMYVWHGLLAGAAAEGCDVLLVSEWGNNAFSDKGIWAYVEYLLTGRWGQLAQALRAIGGRERSLLWRFIAQSVIPLFPDRMWEAIRRLILGPQHSALEIWQPFTEAFRESSGANRRFAAAGYRFDRYQPRSARHARQLLLQNDDGEGAEIYQAFEQMYGIPQRDPMAYRPLVEFCWSLPTRMFMRDGQARWLAKQLGKGIMPEHQRANRLNGRWDADWHLRIGRRRTEFLARLKRLDENPRYRGMFDIPRMTAALEDWPEQTETDQRRADTIEFAIPHALLAADFIDFAEGRNDR